MLAFARPGGFRIRAPLRGGGSLLIRGFLLFAHGLAFQRGVRDARHQQFDGADGVVVGRDHIVNTLRVAVRVHHRNYWDFEQVGLTDRRVLASHIHKEKHFRQALHFTHAFEAGEQAVNLAPDQQAFLFGQAADLARLAQLLEAIQFLDTGIHGGPVGEHTAQPALGDIGHATAERLFLDGFLRLALGADEQHRAAIGDRVAHDVESLVQQFDGLLQVNDMNAVALREDIRLHAGVPLVGAMSKVDAALEQGLHGYNCHGEKPPCVWPPPRSPSPATASIRSAARAGESGGV